MPVGVPILVCFELVFCYFFVIENEEYVYSYLLSLLYPVHSKKLLSMLTSSGDICKSTHNLFLVIFYGGEGMVQIYNKTAAHAGVTRSMESSKRNRQVPGFRVSKSLGVDFGCLGSDGGISGSYLVAMYSSPL